MAVYKNTPPVVTNGLVFYVDANNPQSYIGDRNLLKPYTWTVSSGSAIGFNQNGATNENRRVYGTDPFGKSSVLWATYPQGLNNDDGGWDTTNFRINQNQLYRFSVWVKRTSTTTSGNFYLGVYGKDAAGSNIGVVQLDNGSTETNAYWDCPNIGIFTKDVWYLVVGHIYPVNTTYTGRHPDTGVYTTASGKVWDVGGCTIGSGDVKWQTGSVFSTHRTYHYYSADTSSQVQFFDPRVDLCDGTQPSINDLLTDKTRTWYDLTTPTLTGSLIGTGYDNNKKCLLFASSSNSTCLFNNIDIMNFNTGSFSIEVMVRLTATASGTVNALYQKRSTTGGIGGQPGYQYRILNSTTTNAATIVSVDNGSGNVNNVTITSGASTAFPYYTFIHSVLTFNSESLKLAEYRNGILINPESLNNGIMTGSFYNNNQPFRIGKNDGNSLDGEYYFVKAYNRILTQNEVIQNFNSAKTRIGLT